VFHRSGRTFGAYIGLLCLTTTAVSFVVQGRAVADTSAYELYCPGTPVGTVVMNGVITTGSLSPSRSMKGKSFSITNYQTTVPLPGTLVEALAALGATEATGSMESSIDVSKARPASQQEMATYSSPIPSSPTGNPLPVSAPASPTTVGPFKATSSRIVVKAASQMTMILDVVEGSTPLTMDCQAYPNNTLPTGITNQAPSGSPIAPVIAKSG